MATIRRFRRPTKLSLAGVLLVLSTGLALSGALADEPQDHGSVESHVTPTATPYRSSNVEVLSQIGGSVTAVAVEGSLAFLGIGKWLVAVDVSDLRSFRVVGQLGPLPGRVQRITVVDALAYVATGGSVWQIGGSGLHIIDVSR